MHFSAYRRDFIRIHCLLGRLQKLSQWRDFWKGIWRKVGLFLCAEWHNASTLLTTKRRIKSVKSATDLNTAFTGQRQGQPAPEETFFLTATLTSSGDSEHKSEGGLHPDSSRKARAGTVHCPQAILQLLQLKTSTISE